MHKCHACRKTEKYFRKVGKMMLMMKPLYYQRTAVNDDGDVVMSAND